MEGLLCRLVLLTSALVTVKSDDTISTVIVSATINQLYNDKINSSFEKIYQFNNISEIEFGIPAPLRVHSESFESSYLYPITVIVRQGANVNSWQIPTLTETSGSYLDRYRSVNRTLCPANQNGLRDAQAFDSRNTVYVTISTSSQKNVSFNLMVFEQKEFHVQFDETHEVTLTPSTPIFYQLHIPNDLDIGILRLKSSDLVCMTLSIQNLSCPVHDLISNVEFDGFYQTVQHIAGISFSKEDFPLGLFIVLIVRPDDVRCSDVSQVRKEFNWRKTVEFSVSRKISLDEYIAATFGAFLLFLSAYVFVFLSFCVGYLKRTCGSRNLQVVEDSERRPLLVNSSSVTEQIESEMLVQVTAEIHSDGDGETQRSLSNYGAISQTIESNQEISESIVEDEADTRQRRNRRSEDSSVDELDFDLLEDVFIEKDIFRTKTKVVLSDLSRKSNSVLTKKANLYHWNLMTIATFYGLPVVQLVFTYQNVSNSTGNQDLCYFNFLCAQKLGLVSDFNHIFSNLGYVMLGILFILICSHKERRHRKAVQANPALENLGIPKHFGLYYAMGLGLIVEGIMSGCYHVCPNHTNFQFDTAFMYTISILILLKVYQTRHPDINANAYTSFGVLAFIILLSTVGVLKGSLLFWIFFTTFHILSCLLLSVNIYYMGRWKLNGGIFKRIWLICVNDCRALCGGHWRALKPLYIDRMILLLIMNAANWGMSGYGVFVMGNSGDFGSFLIAVFISNVMMYTLFYIAMKVRYRENITGQPAIYLLISTVTWIGAIFFFVNKSTTWKHSPAQSRNYNQDCKILHFYDNHDIWHFLSAASLFFSFMLLLTLDDDLDNTPRDQIAVF